MVEQGRLRVCVVGSGTHFLSGISYYTHRLAAALAGTHEVSAILMRRLLPTRFYPGRGRVGAALTRMRYPAGMPVYDGVDWYWLPSILGAIAFVVRARPDVVVFQWWSGTVAHSYVLLAAVARLLGTRVVIEFHEVLDAGELNVPLARTYVGVVAPLLVRLTQGAVVHSDFDRVAVGERYKLGDRPLALIRHGPYTQYRDDAPAADGRRAARGDEDAACNLLFFGVIRPFKGLEDLILAFDGIPEDEIGGYRLTVVGETWEGWMLPAELMDRSRYRDRITFVNRYVTDEEVAAHFAAADAVVLPYHRSSASGPLHVAMGHGLPVVVTRVGGLIEAAAGYEGAVMVPPQDPAAIRAALARVAALRGRRFADPHSWEQTVERYDALFAALGRSPKALRGLPVP